VGADLFAVVMGMAGARCWCTGQCGSSHAKTEGRCLRSHDIGGVHLIAAPADPATPERAAVALPSAGLRAWCPSCLTGARRAAQRAAKEPSSDQCSLFDL
jgi:hypothetical protein